MLRICQLPLKGGAYVSLPPTRVRVSGGHLCEAEAPTEPAGEN